MRLVIYSINTLNFLLNQSKHNGLYLIIVKQKNLVHQNKVFRLAFKYWLPLQPIRIRYSNLIKSEII